MASTNLREELQLTKYYPQRLSFCEAIKLRGETENGCQIQYGLQIIEKLLKFDSTAVSSVTFEMNRRLNNTDTKETESKAQCATCGERPAPINNVRPSWRNNAERDERKFHPMDALVVVMNCCDDFLRQILVEKMFINKLSVPILLPDLRNGSYTLLLMALKSLCREVQDQKGETYNSLTDTLVDLKNPIISFIRVGNLHRSKSKLLNELLYSTSKSAFFDRECEDGSVKRSVSNGSIEAAWFQSETASEFNCKLFTALNLRGNARDYQNQTQFLCQSSTLVVFMVDSFESFKELYENIPKNDEKRKTNIIVCYISTKSPDNVDDRHMHYEYLDELTNCGILSEVKYDWLNGTKKMSDIEFVNDLRKSISNFFRHADKYTEQMQTYSTFSRSGKDFGFLLDDDKFDSDMKANAEKLVDLVLKQAPDCKPKILPLQGEPWEKIGKLEREQRGLSPTETRREYFIAEKETEKTEQRQTQCRSLIEQNEVAHTFCLQLQDRDLMYYLNFWKINLDVRSRVNVANFTENYRGKQEKLSNEEKQALLNESETQIANSTIGLEHFLREVGQIYEAVSSEEIRMKEALTKARITPEAIRSFPAIMARLLLTGQPLELMDGDTSNVPITWLKAVLKQIKIETKHTKVFVLSIIGVQSSGKSTLLNALFGLQCPVSAGRCTKGIYCHLVPVDRETVKTKYGYVLIVDTEGLGSSQATGKSTFRDNELATFAIGLADATIINMKGENWAEMSNILQIAAHGILRVTKTKAKLELMPRCIFVHQNVPATDAEKKNRLGQDKQLVALDTAIKEAAGKEGFTEITKFNQVIKYDPDSHSWYFPDLWNGTPPKAKVNQAYTGKANELRKYLMQLLGDSPSNLTISSFSFRMSDLWNAMLHNDFLLCFRNTQEILMGTALNDKISHEVDSFKKRIKLEQKEVRESIYSTVNVEELDEERILVQVIDALEELFKDMKDIAKNILDTYDISVDLKVNYDSSLNKIKNEELRRIKVETKSNISVHKKKLEIANGKDVRSLKFKLDHLEKHTEVTDKDKLNEKGMRVYEERWKLLISDNERLVNDRTELAEKEIVNQICDTASMFIAEKILQPVLCAELFKVLSVVEIPKVTEKDIVPDKGGSVGLMNTVGLVSNSPNVNKVNEKFHDEHKKWIVEFEDRSGLDFDASHLEEVMFKVGQILDHEGGHPATANIMSCIILPPGYRFKEDYRVKFLQFACKFVYNRLLENSKKFISMTDPLADISERQRKSLIKYRMMIAEANIDAVGEQIFEYAKSQLFSELKLGELIKDEVTKADHIDPTFTKKRDFLRTILKGLGEKTQNLTHGNGEKKSIFKDFMLYVEMGESKDSENFFLDSIWKLLKEILTKGDASETDFQRMVTNNVGRVVEKAKKALIHAEAKCERRAREYVRIFKDEMNITDEIYIRINILDGFTKAVLEKIDKLYASFFSQGYSSIEKLESNERNAAIRPLFEKIMGCRERCPFCSAPCSQSLQQHPEDHRANHYPTGVSGVVIVWGLFTDTLETPDATEENEKEGRKPKELAVDTCQTLVGTSIDIRSKVTMRIYDTWFHRLFQLDGHSFKGFKELQEYKKWDIPLSQDSKTSRYWKWFMAQFFEELAAHYKALCPAIPEPWKKITWEEAKESLDESDYSDEISQLTCSSGLESMTLE